MKDVEIIETELTEDMLETLVDMSKDWEEEGSCYGYRKNDRSDIEGNRVFVMRKNGCCVGYLFGHASQSRQATSIMPDGTWVFEVEELYIRPAFRSQGLGRQLFQWVEKTLAGEVAYIMLSTATKNWKAILHFYIDELGMEFWSARLYKKIPEA